MRSRAPFLHPLVGHHATILYDNSVLGAQRNRLLNTLFKDERCSVLTGHSILRSMYVERLIKPHEVFQLSLY